MRKSVENLAGRKVSGGRKVALRGRRKFEIDRYPNEATLGPLDIVSRKVRGRNIKTAFKAVDFANITDPASNKTIRAKIIRVSKNNANKDYERRGVISKGAVLETEAGLARVLSRPGQHGTVNAIAIK
ncbi:MAG TPA: 30S ribosomal protein S8e [Nitrososphaeraceae archaeon]|nr:30S ribosomal protein S8e [Nitrososphaeraceae archaeon]